jgi:hypothetical protein
VGELFAQGGSRFTAFYHKMEAGMIQAAVSILELIALQNNLFPRLPLYLESL